MSEKISILTLLPDELPYFICDNTKLSVPLQRPSTTAQTMYASGGLSKMAAGENFSILSAGFVFPESFGLASAPANQKQTALAINIGVSSDSIGGIDYIPQFGLNGVQLPLENYEFPLGVFVNANDIADAYKTSKYTIKGTLRGLDENYSIPNPWDASSALPSDPCIYDTYTCTSSGSGWTSGVIYRWSGTAWDVIAGTGYDNVLAQVSQVGCPTVLNGKRIRVTVFIKILHTLPMTIS